MPRAQFNIANFKLPILLVAVTGLLYIFFAYGLERTDFIKLISIYTVLFIFAFLLLRQKLLNFKFLIISGLLLRLLLLIATPNLSQDFYRFIWDGRMIIEGFNPYLYTPDTIINSEQLLFSNMTELHHKMGPLSASHFSNYPPLNQFLFVLSNLFSGNSITASIIGLRLIIILADLGVLYFGIKLLKVLKLPQSRILWYFLNPFIIIELTGNLHFEGVMACFLILSIWLMTQKKWILSAVFFGCSISIKLLPLILLPLISPYLLKPRSNSLPASKSSSIKTYFQSFFSFKSIKYVSTVFLLNIILFIPFFSQEFIGNYGSTIALWFGNFEFNASIYYIARAIGYSITGYNEIAIISKILPVIVLIIIFGISVVKNERSVQNLVASMVIVLSCYLFLSTTIHPWYLVTVVALALFTPYKFPFIWSFVVVLSYWAYSNVNFEENYWLLALEYCVVFYLFMQEVILGKKISSRRLQ